MEKNDCKHRESHLAPIYQAGEELCQRKPESATLSQSTFMEEFYMLRNEILSLNRNANQEAC